MSLATNLEAYARYLTALKNKAVRTIGGRTFYRDLFRSPGIAGDAIRQARLLAGVVHGYFLGMNYTDERVPVDALLDGFVQDETVDQMLAGTTYIHAGRPLLANRQANIDAAIRAFIQSNS